MLSMPYISKSKVMLTQSKISGCNVSSRDIYSTACEWDGSKLFVKPVSCIGLCAKLLPLSMTYSSTLPGS